MLLLFKKPHRHEGRKIAVVAVVTQKHFSRRQRSPFGDGIHFDRLRLLVSELAAIKVLPRNIGGHVPAHGFH